MIDGSAFVRMRLPESTETTAHIGLRTPVEVIPCSYPARSRLHESPCADYGKREPSLAQPGSGGSSHRPTWCGRTGRGIHIDEVGLRPDPLGCRLESLGIFEQRRCPPMAAGSRTSSTPYGRGQTSLADAADPHNPAAPRLGRCARPEQKVVLQTVVLERSNNLRINDRDAWQFYVSLPQGRRCSTRQGLRSSSPVRQFVVFELIVPEQFRAAKGIYETSVATAKFLDAELVSQERGMAVGAGRNSSA